MQQRSILVLSVLVLVACLCAPAWANYGRIAGPHDVPDDPGSEPKPEAPSPGVGEPCDAPCPNQGVAWVPPQDVMEGSQECPRVRIGLHWMGFGLALDFGTITCPRWFIYTPGYYATVPKNCYSSSPRPGGDGRIELERFAVRCGFSSMPGVATTACVVSEEPEKDSSMISYREQLCDDE